MALYPKTLYHKTNPPKRVWTEESEKQAKEQGWEFTTYQRQEFPKTMYHATHKPRIVKTAEELKALGPNWLTTPQEGNIHHIDPATVADTDRTEMLERAIDPSHSGAAQMLHRARLEDKAKAAAEEAGLDLMSKADLLKHAEEHDIEVDSTGNKASIIAQIVKAKKAA